MVQAVVWLLTTGVAWLAARNRQLGLHQIWMARSYGVTFTFVLSRSMSGLPLIRQLSDEAYVHFLWVLLVSSLLIPELLLTSKWLILRRHNAKTAPSP